MSIADRFKELAEKWWSRTPTGKRYLHEKLQPVAVWGEPPSIYFREDVEEDPEAALLEGMMLHVAFYARASMLTTMTRTGLCRCESPVEKMMLAAIWCAAHDHVDDGVWIDDSEVTDSGAFENIIISPQHAIGEYRVDFLLTYLGYDFDAKPHPKPLRRQLIVEVDGHDFHEKTKEQASRDKRRDRALQKAGFQVFRYSGADVWRDVMRHADEAIHAVMGKKWKEEERG